MNRILIFLVLVSVTSACMPAFTQPLLPSPGPTQSAAPAEKSIPETPEGMETGTAPVPTIPAADDFFTQRGISLPAPSCGELTQPQTEGPYYKAGSPERNSLYEEGMDGTPLILVGYILDQNCMPLPNVWLDFWQADARGQYDNEGYHLRGHQFSDLQGRYYLETVLPGLYSSRPIEHIHVKLQSEGGEVVISQLYFPDRPVDGLTVALEERGDTMIGYFNFVVQR